MRVGTMVRVELHGRRVGGWVVADDVELCLFDADDTETRMTLPEVDAFVWHGFLPNIEPSAHWQPKLADNADGDVDQASFS